MERLKVDVQQGRDEAASATPKAGWKWSNSAENGPCTASEALGVEFATS
jgi:hypothetical protein